jgi:hypothetical protein
VTRHGPAITRKAKTLALPLRVVAFIGLQCDFDAVETFHRRVNRRRTDSGPPVAGSVAISVRWAIGCVGTGASHDMTAIQFAAHALQLNDNKPSLFVILVPAPRVPPFHNRDEIARRFQVTCYASVFKQLMDAFVQSMLGTWQHAIQPSTGN